MYISLIFTPLISSISAGLFGRKLGIKGSQLLTSSGILITTLLAIISFIEVGLNNASVSIQLFK
jgi:NADH-ubiquinone oxidoreductase chain 5